MPTSRVWPSGIVNVTPLTYQIPLSGEINWSNLTDFLVALADGAQSTTFQKFAVRVAVTSPVTLVSPEDCVVATDLTVAGPVTVNLPAGSAKQIFFIIDGKGDAGTNNVTIVPDGTDTIRGGTSLVLANDRAAVMLAFNASDTDWKVIGPTILPGTINLGDITPVPADANMALVRNALGFVIDAFITDVNVSATAAIARTKLGLGTPDHVVINSPTGAFSSEAALASSRGGLGANASTFTGVVHANDGVFTASPVVDADVAANAAIDATKIADGSVDNTEFQRLGTAGTNGAGNLVTTDGIQTLTNKTLGSTNNITGATAASLTNAGTVTIPPGTDTLVNLNSVQTLTNKTISGANNTITNVSLTTGVTGILPIANGGTNAATANAALNNLLPAQAGNTGRVLGTDGTNTSWTTAGGGSGGINLVNSPSTADGWTETGTVFATPVTTTTAGDLPLTPEVTTAIQFVATGSAPEGGGGGEAFNSYPFTVPPALGVKLGVSLYLRPGTGFVSGQWTLSIYTAGGVRQSLSTDSAGVTFLPNLTGQFVSTFDAVAGTSYTVRIARTSGAGAATLNVAEVNVGTPPIVQGAAVGPRTTFTPVWGNVTLGNGTTDGYYYRDGEFMHIFASITWGTTTSASDAFILTTPGGLTAVAPTTTKVVGVTSMNDNNTTTLQTGTAVLFGTNIQFLSSSVTTSFVGPTVPWPWAVNDLLRIEATVPIAEWAGSGTVNLAQNSVEYAYNSSGITAAGATNDVAFAYGPGGVAVGSIISNIAASVTSMRVRFLTPIQETDVIELEFKTSAASASNPWMTAAQAGAVKTAQNTSLYGADVIAAASSNTDVIVRFGNKGSVPYGSASLGGDGISWATNPWVWRVKKSSGGQAVGFGEVVPGVSSGLVSASGLKGVSDSSNAPAGYVGEYFVFTGTDATASTVLRNLGTINLTKGDWDLTAAWNGAGASGITLYEFGISTANNTFSNTTRGYGFGSVAIASTLNNWSYGVLPRYRLSLAADAPYFFNIRVSGAADTVSWTFTARRVR